MAASAWAAGLPPWWPRLHPEAEGAGEAGTPQDGRRPGHEEEEEGELSWTRRGGGAVLDRPALGVPAGHTKVWLNSPTLGKLLVP